ncbi:MutS-like protein, partial [Quaeritorhiza haematococci]
MSDQSNFGLYTLAKHDLAQFMRLDATAVRALNLMPGPQDERRQNIVEALVEDTELRQTLQESHLKAYPDLHRLAKRFQRGTANLQDVVRCYQVVIRLPDLKDALDAYTGSHRWILEETYVDKLGEYHDHLTQLQALVESTIDLDAIENHEFRIKSDFDDDLKETRERMETLSDQIHREASRVADDLGLELDKKLKFEKSPVYGHHLRLTRTDASKIRGNKDYIELATQKAGVLFTTQKLKRLSNEHADLAKRYDEQQAALVGQVIEVTATYCPILETLNQLIAHLDVLV